MIANSHKIKMLHRAPLTVQLLICTLTIGILAVFGTLGADTALAGNLSLRMGGVEETDDHVKPAVGVEFALESGWGFHYDYWGRKFGPVVEKRSQLSLFKKFFPFKGKSFAALTGLSYLEETTTIEFAGSDTEFDRDETETNGGFVFGFTYAFFDKSSFDLHLYWNSSIYPAGDAAILLVTGRKQTFGLGGGFAF